MKFELLRYFTVLAEELHYGRAASRLAITQPTLSLAIKTLEGEVGVMLLARNRKLVQLTPAGAAFLTEARRIQDRFTQGRDLANAVASGVIGRLDIGFGVTLTYRGILDVVEHFQREAPDIEIVMHELPGLTQIDRLLRGELDAGFLIGDTAPPMLRSIPLETDYFALCLPENHPKAGMRQIDLKEMENESFVMLSREANPANYEMIMSMFAKANIRPVLKHRTVNWMTSMAMVAHGRGLVSLVPSTLARAPVKGVALVPLKGHGTAARAMLAWNPAHVSAALQRFVENAQGSLVSRRTRTHEARMSRL